MNKSVTARQWLRAETTAAHELVDSVFSRFHLDDRASYTSFLRAQADAFLPLEAAVEAARPADLFPDWADRRRGHLLIEDLAALDVVTRSPASAGRFDAAPALLGTIYVLEGSRLGGTMLARAVPPDFPRRFLDAGSSKLWRDLIKVLDATLLTEDDRDAAVRAALDAFVLFERSAHRELERADLA